MSYRAGLPARHGEFPAQLLLCFPFCSPIHKSATSTLTFTFILPSITLAIPSSIYHPHSNKMTNSKAVWANGPSVPLTTPFRADESIDHEALAKQVVRLAKAKMGIVLLGTNGEGES